MSNSFSNVIPDDVQAELIEIRESQTDNMWRMGDITNELVSMYENTNSKLQKAMIYSAVGMFVGKKSRTVREYAQIAKLFEPTFRFEGLSFDHYRHAARQGENAFEAIKWCIEQEAIIGRLPTVDSMVAKFADDKPVEEGFVGDIRNSVKVLRKALTPLFNTPLKQIAQTVNSMLDDLEDELTKILVYNKD